MKETTFIHVNDTFGCWISLKDDAKTFFTSRKVTASALYSMDIY